MENVVGAVAWSSSRDNAWATSVQHPWVKPLWRWIWRFGSARTREFANPGVLFSMGRAALCCARKIYNPPPKKKTHKNTKKHPKKTPPKKKAPPQKNSRLRTKINSPHQKDYAKTIHSPAPFKKAQERGISALHVLAVDELERQPRAGFTKAGRTGGAPDLANYTGPPTGPVFWPLAL